MKKKIPLVSLKMIREKSLPAYLEERILSPDDAYSILGNLIGDKDREHFVVLGLGEGNLPNYVEITAIGTTNEASIGIKEILKSAILTNSSKLFLAHNHPSGRLSPSEQDLETTKKIKAAADLFQITVLDHLIIANDKYLSFQAKGLM